MQNDLNALRKWSNLWMIPFNKDKYTKLYRGSTNQGFLYTLRDFPLASTKVVKDLSVQVDDGLKFREHTASAVAKATCSSWM